jgi:hypothetical protein
VKRLSFRHVEFLLDLIDAHYENTGTAFNAVLLSHSLQHIIVCFTQLSKNVYNAFLTKSFWLSKTCVFIIRVWRCSLILFMLKHMHDIWLCFLYSTLLSHIFQFVIVCFLWHNSHNLIACFFHTVIWYLYNELLAKSSLSLWSLCLYIVWRCSLMLFIILTASMGQRIMNKLVNLY